MKRAIISVSGGMDSTGLLVHLLRENYKVDAVSFNYGQKHSIELVRLKKNIAYLKENNYDVNLVEMNLSSIMSLFNSSLISKDIEVPKGHYEEDNMKSTVVPNRNAIFSAIIYGYALSVSKKENTKVHVALGTHSGDHVVYPDCRQEFFEALNYAFKIGNWDSENVEYYLPYINDNKYIILKDTKESCDSLNLDFYTVLENTNTCYDPNEKGESCGKCGSCTERLEAFKELQEIDPVKYQGVKKND